ncbi:MAG: hypothetical protein AABX39_05180 [Nanoarchaeota archaeon]
MSLNELAKLVNKKREELEEAVRRGAEKIKLQEIVDEIVLQPEYFHNQNFKYGQKLNLVLKSDNYTISVDPQQVVLKDFQGTEIKNFYGSEIKKVYDELLSDIKKENEIKVVR